MELNSRSPVDAPLTLKISALCLFSFFVLACGTTPRNSSQGNGGAGKFYKNDGPLSGISQQDIDSIKEPRPVRLPLVKGTMKPYTAFGQRFTPMTHLSAFSETGVASWYGSKYQGLATSSGEKYDAMGLTAAHPLLPLPSFVRVTNLDNGRTLIVRVNDRGPFLRSRIIDVSYAAARKLGFAEKGSANVRIDAILP